MQCCKKYRHIFGIVIGAILILASLIVCICSTISLIDSSVENMKFKREYYAKVMLTSLLTTSASALFIFGIVKKRHHLLLPWLLLWLFAIVPTCLYIFVVYFAAVWGNSTNSTFLLILFIGAAIVATQIAVFWLSCVLYREIRKKNLENIESVQIGYQEERTSSAPILEKSTI